MDDISDIQLSWMDFLLGQGTNCFLLQYGASCCIFHAVIIGGFSGGTDTG